MYSTRHLVRVWKHTFRASSSSWLVRQFPTADFPRLVGRDDGQRKVSSLSGVVTQKAESISHPGNEHAVTISNTTLQNDNRMMEVQWGDGGSDLYPYIWMRDNCQCPQCFHPTSKSRRILLKNLKLGVSPISVKLMKAGSEVEIDWSDGHKGFYPSDWLHQRSFKEENRDEVQRRFRFHRSFWGSEYIKQLPKFSFSSLLEDDQALLSFLQQVEELGLVIIRDAPTQWGALETLSVPVGYLKPTHYGPTFRVMDKVGANNLAYTSDALDMHNDLPYLNYKPGVQLLHCISQTSGEGGENDFVDSFHVAYQLQDLHPEKFDILTTVPVDFRDEVVEENSYRPFYKVNQESAIVLDQYGLVKTVNLSQFSRDSHFDVSVEKVHNWYDAMLTFYELLYHPDNIINYKMEDGDIAVFDNNRVLHGRKGYSITEGTRQLEGGYWDWDVVRSCRNVLKAKFGLT